MEPLLYCRTKLKSVEVGYFVKLMCGVCVYNNRFLKHFYRQVCGSIVVPNRYILSIHLIILATVG